ncbi:MAG: DNA lyase [Bacteroidetes bacterium]|nr:MAG: DNA lyase [Bacteroidota bacterium]
MRIWSLHPKYLDAKGLVALWRETLLAKHVLEGLTTGYKNHPQLIRFKQTTDPPRAINLYLEAVYRESLARGYRFNKNKFTIEAGPPIRMTVTDGQLKYEWQHLLKKLAQRDPEKFQKLSGIKAIECHPLFEVTEGGVEDWEIV